MMKRKILSTGVLTFILVISGLAQNKQPAKTQGSNYDHAPNTLIKEEGDTLVVYHKGSGNMPVVMISGHMQGEEYYDNMVERNKAFAHFHIVIPPGMAGSPAYPWPQEKDEFLSRPWTSQFENDLIDYLENQIDGKSLLLANWYTGLDAVLNIAGRRPELVAGLLVISPARRSPFYRWYNYDRTAVTEKYDAEAQRTLMKSRMIDFWREVPEFVWHSNTLSGSFYSNDNLTGRTIDFKKAKNPFQIQMRYFIEYMMDDLSDDIQNLTMPVQVVANLPSLETVQAQLNRSNSEMNAEEMIRVWREQTTADWQTRNKDNVWLTFIEDSGMMVWEDHPEEFNRIFREFLKRLQEE